MTSLKDKELNIKPGLIEQFIHAVQQTTATAENIPATKNALTDALLKASEDEEFILLADPDVLDPDLFSIFKSHKRVITRPDTTQLASIRTGVTDAFCGVASTGSVCVPVSINLSSPVSMLTLKHIAVVHAKTIVPRPRDVFSKDILGRAGLTRSFTFITGPSATADMGPLVRGVHGPGYVHIIILE